MRTDTPARDAPEWACSASPPEPGSLEPFVQPPALLDVMVEQITYLAGHTTGACSPRCADCIRLQQAKRWLLAPFA